MLFFFLILACLVEEKLRNLLVVRVSFNLKKRQNSGCVKIGFKAA